MKEKFTIRMLLQMKEKFTIRVLLQIKEKFTIRMLLQIRVITKLPNTKQSSKGKGKTHKSTNRQNQSTSGKLGKPQWP